MKNMNKVAKSAIYLMIATILSKILGFARELVLSSSYGASAYSDAYITAVNIPVVIFSAVGMALATTVIPLYYEKQKIGGSEKGIEFINNIMNIVLIISSILAILGFIFARQLVGIVAIGFEGETLDLAIKFTRILIFGIIFVGISNIITSYLQTQNQFAVPGLIGVPFNIIVIISIILSVKINIYILPIGTLIGIISQFLFQYPFAKKLGYKYKYYINIKDEYIKKMMWLVCPVFIGVSVNQINAIVDRCIASTLMEGTISALNYANRLNGFVIGLFIASIGAVIYPMLSKLSNEKNQKKFIKSVSQSINSVILLVIPVSVGAMVLSYPIVKLLFERGQFSPQATAMTASALVFFSIGMVAFGLRDILGKVFYSLQDTKTPMINGAISMILNIILSLILVKFMGHNGLAFATSLSSILCIILLFVSLKKKIGYFGQDNIIKTSLKSLGSAILMGIVTFYSYNQLSYIIGSSTVGQIISLGSAVFIGALVYFILIVLLKIDEVEIIKSKLKKIIESK